MHGDLWELISIMKYLLSSGLSGHIRRIEQTRKAPYCKVSAIGLAREVPTPKYGLGQLIRMALAPPGYLPGVDVNPLS